MVSVLDVARQAGVSAATVSRVLSGGATVAVETRARVMEAVQQLGYRPNAIAQSLRRGRGRTVALVTGDIEQGVYAALAREIQSQLGELDLELMLFDMAHDDDRLMHFIERSSSLGLRGLMLAVPHMIRKDVLDALMRTSAEAGIVTLSVSQRLDHYGIASIAPDDVGGGETAARHLLERKRKAIGFIGRITKSAVGRLRYDGVVNGLAAQGKTLDPSRAWDVTRGYRFEAGYELVSHALKQKIQFDAVVGASDEVALGGIAAAQDFGLRVPDDIAFVGFGGLRWGGYTRPSLTSVCLDVEAIAAAVGDAFRAVENGGKLPILQLVPSPLVVRQST